MDSRRDFLKKAALLSGSVMWESVPESILRAIAIDPAAGSTFLDAEHIVILMQENRSFDHSYGTLSGVRGYNDPRAHVLPNLNPVWLQTNSEGETYAPFRLNIKETNVTWMGSLPHSWGDQVEARNGGRYDKWLLVKPSYYKGYTTKPMTLGHYTREDIPFYYAFADAFTICDYHFCSSLTGTTPNRLHLWSGTIRPEMSASAMAHVQNSECDHDAEVNWTSFPERLEDAGVSWKIYQNELYLPSGFEGEEEGWLSNFGDNPIEYFTQFQVRFAKTHYAHLVRRSQEIPGEVEAIQKKMAVSDLTSEAAKALKDKLTALSKEIAKVTEGLAKWSPENYAKLSQREKNLHEKAFCVNDTDPHFRELETLTYKDGDTEREVQVPKGDIFHKFREDVKTGQLPTVSWLVSPENFSDHPTSAWYGAWYVSEALDILTQNPEVWKKTIFILTYDENDGYFDHIPPFTAPDPNRPETGKVSVGIDAGVEYITKEQDKTFRPRSRPHDSSIGLGYRVPFVVASPWSRGGCVNSQVFDHTSVIQFLEQFLTKKTGKKIYEPNISAWRRAVCGDLTSIFQPYNGERIPAPKFLDRDEVVEGIHKAKFKNPPTGFKVLTSEDIEQIKRDPASSPHMLKQEKGTRKSCALPYELYADGGINSSKTKLDLALKVGKDVFGEKSAGSPFNAYAYRSPGDMQCRAYALLPGTSLSDSWDLSDFPNGHYHLRVDGPNGFMREFKGSSTDFQIDIQLSYEQGRSRSLTGKVILEISNREQTPLVVNIADLSYGTKPEAKTIPSGGKIKIVLDTKKVSGWYDIGIRVNGSSAFGRRFSGRVETGKMSLTDPAMANH